jgi:transposase
MRQEILIGVERRRRWSDDQKLTILNEVGLDGATVADVARHHDLTRHHIYQWRTELRRKGLWDPETDVAFLTVETNAPRSQSLLPGRVSGVEILLGNGRVLRSVEGLSDADLLHLIRVVERA